MSQSIYSETPSSTTITLTNTNSSSDSNLLLRRDARLTAVAADSGTTDVTVEFDYGATTFADFAVITNIIIGSSVTVYLDSWNGSTWDNEDNSVVSANSSVEFFSWTNAGHTKYRIRITRGSATTVSIGSVWLGQKYDFPVDYQLETTVYKRFHRATVELDAHGYPYSNSTKSSSSREWDISYKLTDSQWSALQLELENFQYSRLPFFFNDSNVGSSNYFLCRLNQEGVEADQIAADLYEIRLRIVEI